MGILPDYADLTPLPIIGLADYHIHPDFSIDAVGSVDEFCQAAIARNLAEICFTTHYDPCPEPGANVEFIVVNGSRLPVSVDNMAPYVDAVLKAAQDYRIMGLSVKLGVEFGYYPNCEEAVEELVQRYSFDYVLCGIHEIEGRFVRSCLDIYSLEELAERYYRLVVDAADTGLFDTIAHLGFYLRYGRGRFGDEIESIHEPHIDAVFDALKRSETGLEVNTSAIRHGYQSYYPPMKIINAAKRAGVEVVHLGSDAHQPDQIGLDFEAASALVPSTVVDRGE